jgi:hypothetical protein
VRIAWLLTSEASIKLLDVAEDVGASPLPNQLLGRQSVEEIDSLTEEPLGGPLEIPECAAAYRFAQRQLMLLAPNDAQHLMRATPI